MKEYTSSPSLFVGADLIVLPEVDSTNSYAQNLLKSSRPSNGTVILAEKQSDGRGQRGTSWIAEPGQNITLSIILYPKSLSINKQFYLSRITALAVLEFCRNITEIKNFRIKWPNDIYFEKQKVAGILIENGLRGNLLSYSITGIGLNLNQSSFGDLINATSLALITGKTFVLKEAVKSLLQHFEKRYLQLHSNKFQQIESDYLNELVGLNEILSFNDNHGNFDGTIKGVTEEGKLIVYSTERGKKEYDLKEIKFIL